MYIYVIDNNEYYPEDHREIELFSTEKLTPDEFEGLVYTAYELCDGDYVYAPEVANKIVEIDDRFSFPSRPISVAYVGNEKDDYDGKIRGFRHL